MAPSLSPWHRSMIPLSWGSKMWWWVQTRRKGMLFYFQYYVELLWWYVISQPTLSNFHSDSRVASLYLFILVMFWRVKISLPFNRSDCLSEPGGWCSYVAYFKIPVKEGSVENSLSYPHVLLSSYLDTFTFQLLERNKRNAANWFALSQQFDLIPVFVYSHR